MTDQALQQCSRGNICACRLMTPDISWHCVVQAYGRELQEAYEWCQRYKASRRDAELHQAWDLYYHVFKRINKQLPSLTVLELQYVAPALVRAQVWVQFCTLFTPALGRFDDLCSPMCCQEGIPLSLLAYREGVYVVPEL